jgi:hypothetical protein
MRLSILCISTVVLASLIGISTLRGNRSATQQNAPLQIANQTQAGLQLPITTKQLQPENDVNVELLCGTASVTPPNILNGFQCTLKNNTPKSITAANIIYSTVLEEAGQQTRDSRNQILITNFHADFYEKEKNIMPAESISVGPAGVFTYHNAVVKGVEVYIDYVEFEDNTSMGPDEEGSQIINDFRAGAAKYKSWLARESKQKSIETIIQSVQRDEGLELPEIGLNNISQKEGARRYGIGLRKLYKKGGPTEVQRYLSTIPREIN